jgi:hypothetical protein
VLSRIARQNADNANNVSTVLSGRVIRSLGELVSNGPCSRFSGSRFSVRVPRFYGSRERRNPEPELRTGNRELESLPPLSTIELPYAFRSGRELSQRSPPIPRSLFRKILGMCCRAEGPDACISAHRAAFQRAPLQIFGYRTPAFHDCRARSARVVSDFRG